MTSRSATKRDGPTEEDNEDAKAVLFCPNCRYRGNWTDWCAGDDAHDLRCPSCGTRVS